MASDLPIMDFDKDCGIRHDSPSVEQALKFRQKVVSYSITITPLLLQWGASCLPGLCGSMQGMVLLICSH